MIEVNNLTETEVDQSLSFCIEKISERVLKGEKKEGNISLAFVGPGRMRKINKNYRGRNKVTDVLSFSEKENFFDKKELRTSLCENLDSSLHSELGEIIICLREIKKSAQRNKCPFEKELSKVLIHGILHLLGYEHEKGDEKAEEMREKEKHYLKYLIQ